MPLRLLNPPKKRPKSKWMDGFVITPRLTEAEMVEKERFERCTAKKEKITKRLSFR